MALVRVYCGVATADDGPVADRRRGRRRRSAPGHAAFQRRPGRLRATWVLCSPTAPAAPPRSPWTATNTSSPSCSPRRTGRSPSPTRPRAGRLRRAVLDDTVRTTRAAGAADPAPGGRVWPGRCRPAPSTPWRRARRGTWTSSSPCSPPTPRSPPAGRPPPPRCARSCASCTRPRCGPTRTRPSCVPLKILDALPEPGMLTTSPSSRNRDAALDRRTRRHRRRRRHHRGGRHHRAARRRWRSRRAGTPAAARAGRGRDRPAGRRRRTRLRRRLGRADRHAGGAPRMRRPRPPAARLACVRRGPGLAGTTARVRAGRRGAGQPARPAGSAASAAAAGIGVGFASPPWPAAGPMAGPPMTGPPDGRPPR